MTSSTTSQPQPSTQPTPQTTGSLPIVAMVMGLISLFAFIPFLGIAGIVLGIIGLKKDTENRGYSITGIVTGAISTALSLIGVILFIVLIIIGASMPEATPEVQGPEEDDRMYRYDNRSLRQGT